VVNERRLAGYRQALADAGIEYAEKLVIGGFADSLDAALENAAAFFDGPWEGGAITAVYAGYDLQAAALVGVATRRGIPVPSALSVVGTDGLPFAAMTSPPLTTVDLPKRAIGIETLRRAMAWLDGQESWQDRLCPGTLLVRGSSAAPRS